VPRLQTTRLRSVGRSSQPPRASAAATPHGIRGHARSSMDRAHVAIVQRAAGALRACNSS
jgi:hypothetical protein